MTWLMLGFVTLDANLRMKARHVADKWVRKTHYAADENPRKILVATRPTRDTWFREAESWIAVDGIGTVHNA